MKRPPREAGALHIYVVVNVVVLCTHTHESGALLRFFLVGKKKKKKPIRFFPEVVLGWTVSNLLFLFIITCG